VWDRDCRALPGRLLEVGHLTRKACRSVEAMSRYVRLGELLAGVEGAALLRSVLDGDEEFIARRLTGLRQQLDELDAGRSQGADVPELDVETGYAAWAATYDALDNGLIRAEQPVVDTAWADLPVGDALDAACGTGRHAARLAAAGHRTVGIDRSEAMLAVAHDKAPLVDWRIGELEALPFDDGSFDIVVCSLALSHLADPSAAIAELARVLRTGGRLVVSDAHPIFVTLLCQAFFPTATGLAYVRNHRHLHSTYLSRFRASGLQLLDCQEPTLPDPDFTTGFFAGAAEAATALWADVPIALVWSCERLGATRDR
jgi:ubiquinone/menaquinone biosynthesis C-methylase UbiE